MTLAIAPTIQLQPLTEDAAQQIANAYLVAAVGSEYRVANGFAGNRCWYFLIRYQDQVQAEAITVGKLIVDSATADVIPLTDEQLYQVRERAMIRAAQRYHTLARDRQGFVLCTYARDQATQWLSDHLGMHFYAADGQLIQRMAPCWQFAIHFRLPSTGKVNGLGIIQVDSATGQVQPLSTPQIQAIQEHTRAIACDPGDCRWNGIKAISRY